MTEALTISPARPDDISMDYDRLRAEGIEHLEQLASQIWNDFNAHDPGITIMEVLCYAITDLGYRANLPIQDILATGSSGTDPVFFSQQEVLPSNPYTPKDYRKLFIDVAGVKNAWVSKYYRPKDATPNLPDETPEVLNGLYHILLELPDGLNPDSKEAKAIINRVKDRYCANRNLGEDLQKISIVRDCPFCLCVDLELEMDGNPEEILATAMFAIREYCAPHPQFHSFQQMLDAGVKCEDILDGPLLQHGFLPDSELDRAPLRTILYRSDIIRILMETEGVKAVKQFKWKKPEKDTFNHNWCLEFKDCAVGSSPGTCEVFYQPYLDLCCSKIKVRRGVMEKDYAEEDLKEALDALALRRDMPVDRTIPSPERGQYRSDLGEYESVQYEFPENYALGDYDLPEGATSLRRAQQRQLQAYLAFFDQILASYLKQLAGVRDMLSVHQDTLAPTYSINAICSVPGMVHLVSDFMVFDLAQDRIDNWIASYNPPAPITDQLQNLPQDFLRRFVSKSHFEAAMQDLLGNNAWREIEVNLCTSLRTAPEQTDWENFCAEEEGHYFESLQQLTETGTHRQLRRNRIMDHLLARFGEQFTEYSLQLFATQATGSNDGNTVSFSSYLDSKADFLKTLPTLSGERGKAYDYKAKPAWNTDNVAGLKKRVAHLLGLKEYGAASIFCNPLYILKVGPTPNTGRRKEAQLQFLHRENKTLLMTSPSLGGRGRTAKLKRLAEALYVALPATESFKVENTGSEWRVVFDKSIAELYPDFTGNDMETSQPALSSVGFNSEELAERWLTDIRQIVRDSDRYKENFHVLEHILLRPNEEEDKLIILQDDDCLYEGINDLYSFIVSVYLPNWTDQFKDPNFRRFTEQTFRREAPAHIYLRFCWLTEEEMRKFEPKFKEWREAVADCSPDRECNINEKAEALLNELAETPCGCPEVESTTEDPCE